MHKPFKQIQLKWQFKREHISDKSTAYTGFKYEVVLIITNTGFEHKAHVRAETCH